MNIKIINEKHYSVHYTMYNGEDFLVGTINHKGNIYVYEDVLFDNINPINAISSFERLKNLISKYYSTKDSVGKIEEKHPYLF
ncbi:MAG: hypothetical protein IPH32_17400 [Bacteroidetes bacterium]|nr:hypothetical protein [Bacteroidota bacterium]